MRRAMRSDGTRENATTFAARGSAPQQDSVKQTRAGSSGDLRAPTRVRRFPTTITSAPAMSPPSARTRASILSAKVRSAARRDVHPHDGGEWNVHDRIRRVSPPRNARTRALLPRKRNGKRKTTVLYKSIRSFTRSARAGATALTAAVLSVATIMGVSLAWTTSGSSRQARQAQGRRRRRHGGRDHPSEDPAPRPERYRSEAGDNPHHRALRHAQPQGARESRPGSRERPPLELPPSWHIPR